MTPTACFVSASRQNVFFAELLDALAGELAGHGVEIERAVDHFPPARDGLAYVFVPHELMPLLMEDAHPSERQLARSVPICTEQPGTHWFAEAAEIASRCPQAVDINQVGVSALRKLGIDARFLQLGYTAGWDRWANAPETERPIEVTMLAGATPRRLTAVARCADQLAGRRTELHLPKALVPHSADSDVFISGERKWDLLAQSRLLLNVHRGELGYFEWQRAVEAIANGCVLLSEHSLGFAPLVPGEHFLSVSYDSLDVALEGILDDDRRLARVRHAAYELMREEYPLSSSISVLAEAIAAAAAVPVPTPAGVARAGVARPKPPQFPPPAWESVRGPGETAAADAIAEQRELPTAVQALEPTAGDRPPADRLERVGARCASPPRVSVVLTVADQAGSVSAAIESLSVSDFADIELLVVDDASSDGSADRVGASLARAPWIAATVVTRARRAGLAQARNLANELATGELVFFLDALDTPYPHALGRLVRALDDDPAAAFAYGIVAQYDAAGARGLTSFLGWDAQTLRYGNYVGAMTLMRRRALVEIGGFATDVSLAGWEDFALWCAFADRGRHGVRVPEVLARQSVMPESPAAGTAGENEAWSLLLDRFACLSASAAA